MILNIITSFILCLILAICIHVVVNNMAPDVVSMFKELYPKQDKKMNNEYKKALQELYLAEQNLDYAEKDFIDAAIYEQKAVAERLNNIIREHKVS